MLNRKRRIDPERIARILPLCVQKDREAWDEFIKAVSPFLSCVITNKFQRLGLRWHKSEIESIKQSILVDMWERERLAGIKDPGKIISWLCAIAHHTASNYLRSIKADRLPKAEGLSEGLESAAPGPSETMAGNDLRSSVSRALESLSPKERIVIKLLYIYDKKHKDIADILNMPIGTVLAYASRARAKLRVFLKDLQ